MVENAVSILLFFAALGLWLYLKDQEEHDDDDSWPDGMA